jgi:DNA-binding response OmpR family regulator
VIKIGPLEINGSRATLGGRPLQLGTPELRLLCHLAEHAGRVHTRDALMAAVWRGSYDPRTVDVTIARLRAALAASKDAIVTVRRIGYRLDPERLA